VDMDFKVQGNISRISGISVENDKQNKIIITKFSRISGVFENGKWSKLSGIQKFAEILKKKEKMFITWKAFSLIFITEKAQCRMMLLKLALFVQTKPEIDRIVFANHSWFTDRVKPRIVRNIESSFIFYIYSL
jgi:hypothetical protein